MRVLAAARALAALMLALNAAPSLAQSAIMCPHSDEQCVETETGCMGAPASVWREGECGCQPSFFNRVDCFGGGMSGSYPCPGSTGNDCTYYPCWTVTTNIVCDDPDPEPLEPPEEEPEQPKPTPPCPAAGEPVSLTTGAMFLTHTDAVVGELRLSRTFNSQRTTNPHRYGAFGPGWNSPFDQRFNLLSAKTIEARRSNGRPQYYFDDNADGVFEAILPYSKESHIEAVAGGFAQIYRRGGSIAYDSAGRITSATDAAGVVTTYTRDAQGRVTSMSRLGRSISLGYSGSSTRPSEASSGTTLLAVYTYNVTGLLDAVSYPDGSGYHYQYADGRVVSVTDASGRMVEAHEYDTQGRATTSEIGNGVEELTFVYGTDQTTVTDALGNVTTYDYANVKGTRRVTKVTGPCTSCGGGGAEQEWAYDEFGNITSYTNALDETWTYTYSSNNELLTETDPLSRVTTYTYDSEGRVLTTSRPGGVLTTLTHGTAGPLTITEKVDATTNRTTTLTYTSSGKPETITDPRNKTTALGYNSSGDLTSVTDPLTHATTFGYDSLGRRTTVTDALSNTTTTAYDARGRVTRITSPDTTHTDFAYDLGGRRTSVTDPLGRKTYYAYDPYGRLESVVDAMNGTTAYEYDLMSNLTSLTDAKGQTTGFEYDGYNRVKEVIYPGGAYETFTYDAGGRLATHVDRKSVTTTYSYDELNRLTGKTYSDGTTPAVSYTYNTAGQLATAANGTDTLTWTYDLAGQLRSEQSTKNSSTVAYTYDLGGNRLSVSLDGTVFVTYLYDDATRLVTITRGTNNFTFGYDNANRRTSLGYPNGVNTSYTYDTLSRLTNLGRGQGRDDDHLVRLHIRRGRKPAHQDPPGLRGELRLRRPLPAQGGEPDGDRQALDLHLRRAGEPPLRAGGQ